jgi:hypothetical protein
VEDQSLDRREDATAKAAAADVSALRAALDAPEFVLAVPGHPLRA